MQNIKRACVEDIQLGKWFWLEFYTAFNGEGGISCPAKVESVDDKKVLFKIFGKDFGIGGARRGQIAEFSLEDIKKGKAGVFIPDQEKMTAHIAKEIEWVRSQEKFLANYLTELQSVPK